MTAAKLASGSVRLPNLIAEHPVASIFVLALAVRILVVAGINLLFGGFLFADDVTYHQMADELVSDVHTRWDPYTQYLFNTTATFLLPLTWLYELFGSHILLAQLFVATMGAGAAALVALFLLELSGQKSVAVGGGVAIALLPSQILWSSLVLKDAQVWLLLAALAVVILKAQRATGKRLPVMLSGIAVLLIGLAFLREHTMVVAAFAAAAALAAAPSPERAWRSAGGVLLALLVPWVAGYGPFATTLIFNGTSLQERRINNAKGADSAFVNPTPPVVEERSRGQSRSPGVLLPPADEAETRPTAGEADIAHLPTGLAYILFAPFPWGEARNTGVALARLESLVWYPLLVLGLIGVAMTVTHRARTWLLFPMLAGSGSVFIYALTEGNVGTAYRHRGEFVWATVIMAVVAFQRLRRTNQQIVTGSHP